MDASVEVISGKFSPRNNKLSVDAEAPQLNKLDEQALLARVVSSMKKAICKASVLFSEIAASR